VLTAVVSGGLTLPVEVEPYGPEDGEYAAGQRLLGRLRVNLGARLVDYVVVDGGFATATFLHAAAEAGWPAVARLKDSHYAPTCCPVYWTPLALSLKILRGETSLMRGRFLALPLLLFVVVDGAADLRLVDLQVRTSTPTNPLRYNAVTDGYAHDSPAPKLGRSGTTTTDPDFGTTVLRVTQGGSCGGASTDQFSGADAGWKPIVSVDDTGILIGRQDGYVFWQPINPTNMTLNGSCQTVVPTYLSYINAIGMSRTTPNLVYGLSGTVIKSVQMPRGITKAVHDMAAIPGFRIHSPYLLYFDAGDQLFCTSNNYQDAGTQLGCYNKSNGTTYVLNLANATVQTNSGSPVALDNLNSSLLAGCGIHEFIVSDDATWVKIEFDECNDSANEQNGPWPNQSYVNHGEVFWQVGTNHVTYEVYNAGGHQAMGWGSAYINSPGTPPFDEVCGSVWGQYIQALEFMYMFGNNLGSGAIPPSPPAANYTQLAACNPPLGQGSAGYSVHQSWLNNYGDSYQNQYPIFANTAELTSLSGVYLMNEIFAVSTQQGYANLQAGIYRTSSNATIWRFAHTYNDPTNNQCGGIVYDTVSVSADGKYAAFTSDWMGQTGTGPCTNNRRTDLFLVKLPVQ
jgi:hypothetical protein